MEFIDQRTLQLDKALTELDLFVLEFARLLERYTSYVIVSGYVAILFGRARATEDVDIFIQPLEKERFVAYYDELERAGYWCLNAETACDSYDYLAEGIAVRFAKKGQTIPNIEVKFAKKTLAQEALRDTITVITKQGSLVVSSLERQIAFKRYYLKSDKDLEDARHIEEAFKGHIDVKKVQRYKRMIEDETI